MSSYEYNEEDLPEVTIGDPYTFSDGAVSRIVHSGKWSMEYIDPPLPEDGDTDLEEVERTILCWIAYRNWLEKNPPKGATRE